MMFELYFLPVMIHDIAQLRKRERFHSIVVILCTGPCAVKIYFQQVALVPASFRNFFSIYALGYRLGVGMISFNLKQLATLKIII